MAASTTKEDVSPTPRFLEYRLPAWTVEYAVFLAYGICLTVCTKFCGYLLQWMFTYRSGSKTRFAILWFLWGGRYGPFYSLAIRPIAHDFLTWRKADGPDAPPAITFGALLKAALFFLPSTVILFDVYKWLQSTWRICWSTSHNIFWGWPLYVFWLSMFHEYTGFGTVGDFIFRRIKSVQYLGLIYLGIMLLQMWYAQDYGANLSIPFCAPTRFFSSWIYSRCCRIPSFWTAMLSLMINVQIFIQSPLIRCWYWELKANIRSSRVEWSSIEQNVDLGDYEYHSLEAGQFRVLIIHRQINAREKIKTSLLNVPLNKEQYDCISYTWDYPPTFRYLDIDGYKLRITKKAYHIIEDRRSKLRDEVIWIDSVCINQSSKQERAQQVDIMCDIYRSAHRTIVWLDPMEDANEGAEAAFSLIEDIAFKVSQWILEPDDAFLSTRRALHQLTMQQDRRQRALVRLFRQKYFLRTWIIQEIVFSKVVHIRCSGNWLSWDKLATAMRTIHEQKYHGLMSTEEMMRSIDQVGVLQEVGWLCQIREMFNTPNGFQPCKLSHVLSRFLYFRATDPRDKLFGILNLTDGKGQTELVPDYTVDAVEIFKRIGSYLLRVGDLDEILYAAGTGYGQRMPGLPSWLLDWTSPPKTERLRLDKSFQVYKASGSKNACIRSLDSNSLSITGLIFDKLVTLTQGKFTPVDQSGNKLFNLTQALVTQLLLDVEIQCLLDMSSTYTPTKQPMREVLRRTLIGDTLRDLAQPMFARPANLSQWESVLTAWEYAVIAMKDPAISSRFKNVLSTNNQRRLEAEFKALVSEFPYHVLKGWRDGIRYFTISRICTAGKKFAITEKGYVALVPPLSRKGDLVCVLYGLEVPFILRKCSERLMDQYEIVGESYVHGAMDGEGLAMGSEEMEFRVC